MGRADILMDDPNGPIPPYRIGVVTVASPISVIVAPATTSQPCRRLASYTPTIGDIVVVLVSGADRVVLGKTTT